jgi:hypothetical protein
MKENQQPSERSLSSGRIVYRPLHAPRENRAALIDPPFSAIADLVHKNVQLQRDAGYDFQGRSLADLRALARKELLRDARCWTSLYRQVESSISDEPGLIFLAGHQPHLFHPGVWWKNLALDMLARRHGATAVNLVIDSDTVHGTSLKLPTQSVQMDQPSPPMPYEERQILDRGMFAAFGSQVKAQIRPLIPVPLIDVYWPLVLKRAEETDNLGECLAQARHQIEGLWGRNTLEVAQSRVCNSESFCWFLTHLLAHLPRLRVIYNQAVAEYRHAYKVRSSAHPVPDLSADGPWLEAPFWVWTADDSRRRRLFARQSGDAILLSDRQSWETSLSLHPNGDASGAVDQLLEMKHKGVKIRSRALMTTLWARLILSDLFIHGIGGAKYDQVSDLIIERFFGLLAPGFMVLSATLQLPVDHPQVSEEDAWAIQRQLRELTHHPEKFLDGGDVAQQGAASDTAALVAEKRQWINTPQTPQNAKSRCQSIRRINRQLQPCVEEQRSRALERQAQVLRALQSKKLLTWREYGFCLYPEKSLREFFEALLPNHC